MIAHVWNEIEHDIGYKPERGELSEDEKFNLAELGRLVRRGDLLVSSLLAAHEHRLSTRAPTERLETQAKDFHDVHDFVSRTRDWADGVMTNFAENSGQLFDLLTDLSIASPEALKAVTQNFDIADNTDRIERFNQYLGASKVDNLRLDAKSSDLLLVALLQQKLPEIVAELKGRAGRGKGRPSRLHRVAVRYQGWLQQT